MLIYSYYPKEIIRKVINNINFILDENPLENPTFEINLMEPVEEIGKKGESVTPIVHTPDATGVIVRSEDSVITCHH